MMEYIVDAMSIVVMTLAALMVCFGAFLFWRAKPRRKKRVDALMLMFIGGVVFFMNGYLYLFAMSQ